jgi:Tfp pilus assembly protein PilX
MNTRIFLCAKCAFCSSMPDPGMLHLRGNPRERGTALIMSLVILMILTILGITAMSTATLQERMSGNIQEGTRAFEVAESALQSTLNDSTQFNQSGTATQTYPLNNRKAEVTTTFLQATDPPRGLGYDNTYSAYHFQQTSKVNKYVDSANTGLNTTIVRGIAQISSKAK